MTLKSGSIIRVNEFLSVNDYIESPNRLFFAILQADGNFVVYKGTRDNQQEAWWDTSKVGNPGKFFAILQDDGNFVVYKGTSPQDQQETWWATNALTSSKGNPQESTNGTSLTGTGPSLDDQPFVPSDTPNPLPAGEAFHADPYKWYHLKVQYVDDNGKYVTGYAYPVGQNAAASFWDYVVLSAEIPAGASALKFKLVTLDDQGWQRWEIHDDACNSGYHLSCKATGWLYRASEYDVRFRIVDGKLYCSYWSGPVGSTYRSFLVSNGQYIGMDLPEFTCELELAIGEELTIVERRFHQWQKDNWETIKNKRLWQIAMPATHDSGCYGKCWQGVVDHTNLDYNPRSKSQGASIYEQLVYGIRQFDLRFKNYGDKYYVFHGADVFDITFDTVLNDIKKFLDETEKEILILSFRFEEKSGQAEVLEKIGTDIVLSKEDVTHLGRNWPANCTPEKLIEIGKRVILLWSGEYVENALDKNEHRYDQYIWYSTDGNEYMQITQTGNYGSAFTTDELIEGRTRDLEWWRHNYRNIYFPSSGKCWFGLGVHLTTLISPLDILPHDDHEHWHGAQYNLETLAGKSLPKVLEKLRGDWKNEPWNLVGADLFDKKQYLDFSEAVIDLNNNNFPYSIPNEQ